MVVLHGVREHIGRRPYMEDRYVIKPNFYEDYNLYAVFDGHGGSFVSEFCKVNLASTLSFYLRDNPISFALVKTFEHLHRELPQEYAGNQGTTALVALVGSHDAWIANTGDSRCIMNDMTNAVQITKDHKPNEKSELERIAAAGGQVTLVRGDVPRVQGQLAVSRAIGDKNLNPFLIPLPDVYHVIFKQTNDFLILGSDGLYDGMSNKEIIDTLLEKFRHPLSVPVRINTSLDRIVGLAADGSFDNITIIIIHLKRG